MVNWSTLLPGRSFRHHYHEKMDEVFIILNGEVEIMVGEEMGRLRKGDVVVIPEHSIHVMKNLTNQEVCYITIGIAHSSKGKTVVL